MNEPKISAVVLVKNEERNIKDCLASLKWVDEIVLLDDESTDNTLKIAEMFGAKVFKRRMDVEGRQRNYAYSKASNEWVISIDADERVTPELANEIRKTLRENGGKFSAYSLNIRTYAGDKWIKGAGYYPAPRLRLFMRDRFRYEEACVHPRVFVEGQTGPVLKNDVLHYPWKDFSELIRKMNRETTLEAEKWIEDGRKVTLAKTLRKAFHRFIKYYFQRGGWREGHMGFIMCAFHSLYQFLTYVKYWEATERKDETGGK